MGEGGGGYCYSNQTNFNSNKKKIELQYLPPKTGHYGYVKIKNITYMTFLPANCVCLSFFRSYSFPFIHFHSFSIQFFPILSHSVPIRSHFSISICFPFSSFLFFPCILLISLPSLRLPPCHFIPIFSIFLFISLLLLHLLLSL